MIEATQIRTMAAQAKIDPGIVEKDYVLSKLLMSLAQSSGFQSALVFKGGTALKKCYYPEWRFSEDLDFTATKQLKPEAIRSIFTAAADTANRQSGLPLRVIEYSQYPKEGDSLTTAQLKIGYDGPLRKSSGQKNNVRVDIAFDETIVSPSVTKPIFHQYTDDVLAEVACYPLEEILAEKLRSILQRGKSRDYYDVWVLLKNHDTDFDSNRTKEILFEKCRSKQIPEPKTDDFFKTDQLAEAERFWERGLAHQLATLPAFAPTMDELQTLLRALLQA